MAAQRSDTGDGTPSGEQGPAEGFVVHLDNFSGPFEVLLSLIGKHTMDVTEVALAAVTDEFIAYMRDSGAQWDLDRASHFVVVAATLLDLKAARLLPSGDVEDEDDLELLAARDLLFARLLQYRAFQRVAALVDQAMAEAGRKIPRQATLEPFMRGVVPDLDVTFGPTDLAKAMAKVLSRPRAAPVAVNTDHVHAPAVSVAEQVEVLTGWLQDREPWLFSALVADATEPILIAARFLAVLELYRENRVSLRQQGSFEPLTVQWRDEASLDVSSLGEQFDDVAETEEEEAAHA